MLSVSFWIAKMVVEEEGIELRKEHFNFAEMGHVDVPSLPFRDIYAPL